jgi:uncharacterized protein
MNLHNAILADSSGLLALVNKKDAYHEAVKPFATANLLVPSTVLCEVDYMMTKYLGEHAARAFLSGQARKEWQLLPFDAVDLESANAIRVRYDDVPPLHFLLDEDFHHQVVSGRLEPWHEHESVE